MALAAGTVSAVTRYVNLNNPNSSPPYTNWPSAATTIQDAIDVANNGDTVLVTNGVYETGGKEFFGGMSNRVALYKPLALVSVNGPHFTEIKGRKDNGTSTGNGEGAIRCVYLVNGASLSGFKLTSGATRAFFDSTTQASGGGGVWCQTTNAWITNCFIENNSSYHWGAGCVNGTLYNCTLSYNSTGAGGGGAAWSTLINCALIGNTSDIGGGAYICSATNCDFNFNQANDGGGVAYGTLNKCTLSGNSAVNSGAGSGDSVLIDCTIINNSTYGSGGGAYGGTLTRCLIISNTAYSGGGVKGYRNVQYLQNCILIGNKAVLDGGGSAASRLGNCTIVGNSAGTGGGISSSSLSNCIVYSNFATNAASNNHWLSSLSYSCTFPVPTNGIGNITNVPLFLNTNDWSNLRLQSNSPCINSGNNSYLTTLTDFDNYPRISGGTLDIGAYEFQSPSSLLSYAWLQQYGLPVDGSADFIDVDSDGANSFQEWRADTIPTNPLSVLRMVNATNSPTGMKVTWQSVSSRSYWLERATSLGIASPFQTIATNIAGVSGTKTFTDVSATNSGPYFYRVGVQ